MLSWKTFLAIITRGKYYNHNVKRKIISTTGVCKAMVRVKTNLIFFTEKLPLIGFKVQNIDEMSGVSQG